MPIEAPDRPASINGRIPKAKRPKPTEQGADKIAADTARYEALAREHGADLSEEGFNEALRKVARSDKRDF